MEFRTFLIAAALAAAGVLASCETMSAEECAAADWRALGFGDAAQNGADRFADRAQSCAEKGFAADGAAYASGFGEGMFQFCQPPNGFQFARRGGSFNGSCPAELQRDFYAAYADGQRVHEAESELNDARNQMGSIESRRREIDGNIRDHEDALRASTDKDVRERLVSEIEALHRERYDTNDDLELAQRRATYAQRHVDDLHYEIGNRWASW